MGIESLWAVTAKRSTMKCELRIDRHATQLLVVQDKAVALRETFSAPDAARAKASALRDRLTMMGWRDAG